MHAIRRYCHAAQRHVKRAEPSYCRSQSSGEGQFLALRSQSSARPQYRIHSSGFDRLLSRLDRSLFPGRWSSRLRRRRRFRSRQRSSLDLVDDSGSLGLYSVLSSRCLDLFTVVSGFVWADGWSHRLRVMVFFADGVGTRFDDRA